MTKARLNALLFSAAIVLVLALANAQPSAASVSFSTRVSDQYDDAEENTADGVMSRSSSDLEMVLDGSRHQVAGLRFQNITSPARSRSQALISSSQPKLLTA